MYAFHFIHGQHHRPARAAKNQHAGSGPFARIHRRVLENVDRVVGLEPWFGGDAVVLLRDGTKLRLSRNFREAFLARMLGDQGEQAGE